MRPSDILSRTIAPLCVLGACVLLPSPAKGFDHIWDGGGVGSTDLSAAVNWNDDTVPSVAFSDVLIWDGSVTGPLTLLYGNDAFVGVAGDPGINFQLAGTQIDAVSIDSGLNTNAIRLNNITIDSGAGAFTLGDGADVFTLNLGGAPGVHTWTNNSSNLATISADVALNTGGGGAHTLAVAGSGNWLFKNVIPNGSGTFALAKSGTGTLTLAGANTYTGTTTVSGGVVELTGKINSASAANVGIVTVGDTADTNAVLRVNGGTINATKTSSPSIAVGSTANSRGFLSMSSGVIQTTSEFHLGRGAGSYAAYSQSGGAMTSGNWLVVGFNNDRAVLNQSGGTITVNANRMTIGAGGTGSVGVVNLSGGTFTANGGVFVGENGVGMLNISGTANVTTGDLRFGNSSTTSGAGTLNLFGGTLSASTITKGSNTTVPYLLNFNGGTLRPTVNNGTLMGALANTTAYIYGGGATINTNGLSTTIAQPLLAPSGQGMTSIEVVNGGAGYLDIPIVTITGGTGIGAQAVANITNGAITGFTITNPGSGYSPGDVLNVALTGGGATTAAVVGAVTLGANVSGGLTKNGLGTLTLTGASTYAGATVINAGTLSANQNLGAPTSNVLVNAAGTLVFSAGTTSNTVTGAGNVLTTGTVTVTGNQSGLTGTFTHNAANASVSFNNALATSANAAYVLSSGGTSQGMIAGAPGTYTLNFGSLSGGATAGAVLRGGNSVTGAVTFSIGNLNTNTTFAGAIANGTTLVAGLTKVGNGELALTGTSTYTGPTLISGGTLTLGGAGVVNGASGITVNGANAKFLHTSSATVTPTVTVTNGTLAGTGTINAAVVGDGTGGKLANGNGNAAALTLGSLTFNGAGVVNATVNNPANAGFNVGTLTTGAVNASGVVTVNVTNTNGIWSNGQNYNLFTYTTLGGAGFGAFSKGVVAGLGARQSATLANTGTAVTMSIAGDLPVWSGALDGRWTTATLAEPKNWTLQTAGTNTDFISGDVVLFNDSASGLTSITIPDAPVNVTSAVFENSSKNYVISSSGGFGIAGGFLTKNGTATVTISTANTYTGGTTVNAGTLVLSGNNNFGTGGLIVNGGTAELSGNNTYSGGTTLQNGVLILSGANNFGSGGVAVNGGTATISGGNNYSGGTTVTNGALVLSGNNTFGTGGISVSGGAATISGTNTYTGNTTLSGGTLNLNSAGALGAGLLVLSGGTLDNTSGSPVTLNTNNPQRWTGNFAFAGTNALNLGAGPVALGADSVAQTLTITNNSPLAGASLTIGGPIASGAGGVAGAKTLTIAGAGNTALTGNISVAPATSLTLNVTSSGTTTLSGTNAFNQLTLNGTANSVIDLGAGVLTIANGGGNIFQSTSGGTINATGGGSIVVGSANGDFGTAAGTTLTLNAPLTGTNALDLFSANGERGTIVLAAANTMTGALNVENTRVVLPAGGAINALNTPNVGQVTVGTFNGSRAMLEVAGGTVNATLAAGHGIVGGNIANSAGGIKISSGTVNTTELWLGNAGTAYGGISLSNGVINSAGWFAIGRDGLGLVNMTGGALNVSINNMVTGSFATVNGTLPSSFGVVNLSGGAINLSNTGTNQGTFILGESGRGNLNVSGTGQLNISGGRGLFIGMNAAGNGVANLNGGVVTTPLVQKGAGTGTLNFGGGTLKASAPSATFLQGLTAAYVNSGGATIDDNGLAITIAQPLLAPTGNGVAAPSITSGGAGYLESPLVEITGGGGSGATAVANIDGGVITSVTITNPGIGYTSSPTFVLHGGGATTPAVLTASANVVNVGGGLTKIGAGVLTLTGANTYTGPTNVQAGSLILANTTGSATGTGALNFGTGTTLVGTGTAAGVATLSAGATIVPGMNNIGTLTLGGLTLGAGSFLDYEFTDPGTRDLISVTGLNGLTINGGTMRVYQAGNTSPFAANGVYNVIGYSGAIGGTGISALSVDPATQDGSKTYTFGTAGGFVTLTIGSAGVLPNFWNVDANGNWTTAGNWSLGVVPNEAGALANFGGGGATITAPRTVTVNANQTVGTLAFNSAQSYTISGASTLTLDGGIEPVAQVTNTQGTHTLSVALAAISPTTQFTVLGVADLLNVAGVISGATSVVKNGSGTLQLSNANTFIGNVSVSSGTLLVSGTGTLGDPGNSVNVSGGTLDLGGTAQATSGVMMTGGAINNGTLLPVSVTAMGAGASQIGANISGNATVTKEGAGSLVLSGNNTYTGDTTVNAGVLVLASANPLGNAANALFFNSGILQVNGTAATTLGVTRVLFGFPTAVNIADAANNFTIPQSVNSSAALVKQGPGSLTLTGSNVFPGTTNTSIQEGRVIFDGGSFTASNSTNNIGIEIAPANGSSAAMTVKNGAVINTNRVIIGGNAGNGTGGSGLLDITGGTINSAQWFAVGSQGTGSSTVNMSGGTVNVNAAGGTLLEVAVFGAATGTFNISGDAQVNVWNNASINMGSAANGSGSATINQSGGAVAFYSDAGTTAGGTGALRIGAANGRTGTYTYNLNGGTLTVPSVTRASGNSFLNFNGGTIRATEGNANYIANTIGTIVKTGGARVDTNGFDIGIQGVLAHDAALGATPDGGLTKTGTGILTLSAANTYTGPTVVEAGTLAVTGSISGTSAIDVKMGATVDFTGIAAGFTVGTGQTLKGAGTVNGNVSLGVGAILSPGESPGVLTVNGNLNLTQAVAASGSHALVFEIGSLGSSDAITLSSGTLNIGTALAFDDFSFSALAGIGIDTYTLFATSTSIAGSLDANSALLSGAIGGGYFGTLALADGGTDLVLVVVPEPGSAMMLLGGLGVMAAKRRRRE